MLAYGAPCAVHSLLRSIRRWYRTERVVVHTDNMAGGGHDFSALCTAYNCSWRGFAETAGNPVAARTGQGLQGAMPFMRRVLQQIALCSCEFLVTLEDYVCLHRPPVHPPPACGDVGGLPGPAVSTRFVQYVERTTRQQAYAPAVYGCAGACYYRAAAWLAVAPRLNEQLVYDAAGNGSWPVGYADSTGPALALATGLRVWPWRAVSMLLIDRSSKWMNTHVAVHTTRLLPQDRVFEHKCKTALALRPLSKGHCED